MYFIVGSMMQLTGAKSKHEFMVLDIDLFIPTFIQRNIREGQFENVFPITSHNDAGPVEFIIECDAVKFMDLMNSFVKVKCNY